MSHKTINSILIIGTFIFLGFLGFASHQASNIRTANNLLADKICQMVVEGEYSAEYTYDGGVNCYKKVL